jgi:hypothetical protein
MKIFEHPVRVLHRKFQRHELQEEKIKNLVILRLGEEVYI